MVIVCVSIDRTRWDSIKISTHLNFESGYGMSTKSHVSVGTEDQRTTTTRSHMPIATDDKVMVEDHVQGPLFGNHLFGERGGVESMASLPELFA